METWVDIIKTKLTTWLTGFVRLLPNLAMAVVVFVFFFFLAKWIRKIATRIFTKLSEKPSVSSLFATIIYLSVFAVGLFISLDLLHLEKTISSLLAGAGIIGLALGFAFQDLTANFISGLFIIFRKPFDVGQIIDTNSFIGTVSDIQLRSTIIRTYQGLFITIPNKDIFQKPLTNYSLSQQRRIDIELSVPFAMDINTVESALKERLSKMSEILKEPATEIYYTEYAADALKMEVRAWIDNQQPAEFAVKRDLLIRSVHDILSALKK